MMASLENSVENSVEKIARNELQDNLPTGWNYDEKSNSIRRDFEFLNFSNAWGFMTQVALRAEAMNHHPDWSNAYDKVSISLTTHEEKSVTQRDLDLASFINSLVD